MVAFENKIRETAYAYIYIYIFRPYYTVLYRRHLYSYCIQRYCVALGVGVPFLRIISRYESFQIWGLK